MYKLIFSDIDGTLLNSNHEISEETKKSVRYVKQLGVPFILVSARMPEGIFFLQKELEIHDPIICFSGALLLGAEQNGEREILYRNTLKEEHSKGVYQIASSYFPSICFTAYTKDTWLVESISDKWVIQEQEITGILAQHFSYSTTCYPPIYKILCMGRAQEISLLEVYLKKYYPTLSIYQSKPTYLEIMAEGVSKSLTIDILANILNISQGETMAFGDNFNDMDMLEYAGLGVAMANAPQQVKDSANFITSSNDEDGLAKVLMDKYLISKLWNKRLVDLP